MENCRDYESIEVPDSYTGPRLSFPLLPDHATALVEAFRVKQVSSRRGTWVTTNSTECVEVEQTRCRRNGPGFRVFVSGIRQRDPLALFLARILWLSASFYVLKIPPPHYVISMFIHLTDDYWALLCAATLLGTEQWTRQTQISALVGLRFLVGRQIINNKWVIFIY